MFYSISTVFTTTSLGGELGAEWLERLVIIRELTPKSTV